MKYQIRIQRLIKDKKDNKKVQGINICGNLENNNRVYEEVWNNPKKGFEATKIDGIKNNEINRKHNNITKDKKSDINNKGKGKEIILIKLKYMSIEIIAN